jgi:UrcA family protein
MLNTSSPATGKRVALSAVAAAAVTALGLALVASSAKAQDYDNQPTAYQNGPNEQVEVYAPRHHQRSTIGAPIEDVSMSRPVRYDDLDLRTAWGARTLKNRIRTTAHLLCERLDAFYPISTDDSPPCYSTAVNQAMYQADATIHNARAYAGGE